MRSPAAEPPSLQPHQQRQKPCATSVAIAKRVDEYQLGVHDGYFESRSSSACAAAGGCK